MGRHAVRRRGVGTGVAVALFACVLAAGLAVLVLELNEAGEVTSAPTSGPGAGSPTGVSSRAAGPTGTQSGTQSGTSPSAAATTPGSPGPPGPTGSASMMPMAPTVELELVGTSWVEVREPGGRVLASGVYRKGQRMVFRKPTVQVIVGNAGAVRLLANGMPMDLGGPGEVRIVTVMRGGD